MINVKTKKYRVSFKFLKFQPKSGKMWHQSPANGAHLHPHPSALLGN